MQLLYRTLDCGLDCIVHTGLDNLQLYHHHVRVAGECRRVVAPPCPRSTARLQRSPTRRIESFRSWSNHLFRGRPSGRRHVRSGDRLSDRFTWSCRAMFAGVSSSSRATCPNQKCVDEIGDGTVKADRSAEVLQHFSSSFQTRLDRTIGFQAAVSDNSGGKHPESSHQQTVRSRCLRHVVTQTRQGCGIYGAWCRVSACQALVAPYPF